MANRGWLFCWDIWSITSYFLVQEQGDVSVVWENDCETTSPGPASPELFGKFAAPENKTARVSETEIALAPDRLKSLFPATNPGCPIAD